MVFRAACVPVLALLGLALPVCAQQPAPPPVVPAGFHFEGTWQCEGTFRNGKTHRAEFTGSRILGGTWLELGERDVEPATGYVAQYLIGYNAQQKRLVEFDANNFSAAVYSSAEGWQKDTLTMTSPVSDDPKAPYAANRFVYTVAAPDAFDVTWQISKTAALNWVVADHLVCKRSG